MYTTILIIQLLVVVVSCLAAVISILVLQSLRWPSPALWFIKLYVSALSPFIVLVGVLNTIVGLTTGSVFISLMGIYIVLFFGVHIYLITRPPDKTSGFEKAFGLDWKNNINPEQKNHFLSDRLIIRLPAVENPRLEQNIPFSTLSESGQQLLCDIWQPPENVIPSGLAFIYLHGGAWYLLDKDFATRPFFRHLAAQGHVIMDVAYRLAPETDMMGMINDVKRAIAWMKENAGSYQVLADRIVVGGGSAGGHLALMAAFTAKNPKFNPKELEGKDFSVCAVISLYGPADLKAMYYHTNQQLTTRSMPGKPNKNVKTQMPEWIAKKMGKNYHRLGMDKDFENAGTFAPLLGGHPDECPEPYVLFSPVMHVHSDCPPTLLVHGEHDCMAPVNATHLLHTRLLQENVPTVRHILPQTDHAFDLILPKISPSAHNAMYDVERFLALQVGKGNHQKNGYIKSKNFEKLAG